MRKATGKNCYLPKVFFHVLEFRPIHDFGFTSAVSDSHCANTVSTKGLTIQVMSTFRIKWIFCQLLGKNQTSVKLIEYLAVY